MKSLFAVTGFCLLLPATAWAQPAAKDGLFLSVPSPITDNYVKLVEQRVDEAIKAGRKIEVVVFDFNPTGNPSSTKAYGSCRDLASTSAG